MTLTNEQKLKLYDQGQYKFPVPPVSTALWTTSDWITFIDLNGEWVTEDRHQIIGLTPLGRRLLETELKDLFKNFDGLHGGWIDDVAEKLNINESEGCGLEYELRSFDTISGNTELIRFDENDLIREHKIVNSEDANPVYTKYITLYLSYKADFITVKGFASYHGLTPDEACAAIEQGRKDHEAYLAEVNKAYS